MAVTINEWCKGAHTRVDGRAVMHHRQSRYGGPWLFRMKRPARATCPVCKRRLIPETVNAEPYSNSFDPIYRIPKHKSKR